MLIFKVIGGIVVASAVLAYLVGKLGEVASRPRRRVRAAVLAPEPELVAHTEVERAAALAELASVDPAEAEMLAVLAAAGAKTTAALDRLERVVQAGLDDAWWRFCAAMKLSPTDQVFCEITAGLAADLTPELVNA